MMASADRFRIFLRGVQTHGAMPWRGIDPIVIGSQVVLGLQTIVSRRMDITKEPSVVTVGVFQGGVRQNIIPDDVKLEGTIRTFDEGQRTEIQEHVKHITTMIAQAAAPRRRSSSTAATTDREPSRLTTGRAVLDASPGTRTSPSSTRSAAPRLLLLPEGSARILYFVGCTPPDRDAATAAPNHSPRFFWTRTASTRREDALGARADWLATTGASCRPRVGGPSSWTRR